MFYYLEEKQQFQTDDRLVNVNVLVCYHHPDMVNNVSNEDKDILKRYIFNYLNTAVKESAIMQYLMELILNIEVIN